MGNFNDMQMCACCGQVRNIESMAMLGGEPICSDCWTEGDSDREIKRILAMSDAEILWRAKSEDA